MTRIHPQSAPRMLGASGIALSPLAWGMWRLTGSDTAPVRAMIDAALAAGITLFDTADIYGIDTPAGFGSAETLLGRALSEDAAIRDRIVLATKGGIRPPVPYDSSAIETLVDASLRRLGVDVIDLYQVHRRDLLTHPQEVAAGLDLVVAKGKVRAVGVSNHSPAEAATLRRFLSVPLVSTQPEFSPLYPQPLFDGTLDDAMAHGMAVLAWSPLGGGRLMADRGPAALLLEGQGERHGVDAAAAALSWSMVHPAGIIPIVGSQRPDRIAAAVDSLRVGWTRQEWYAVLQAAIGQDLP